MVYYYDWALVGMIHAIFGMTWFSVVFAAQLLMGPVLRKATKLVELAPLGAVGPKIAPVGTMAGTLTVITGFLFALMKFGVDPSGWPANPEARAVLVALVVALTSLAIGFLILKPMADEMGKNRPPTPPPPEAEIPPPVKAKLSKMERWLNVQALLMLTMVVMMVLAIEGGV